MIFKQATINEQHKIIAITNGSGGCGKDTFAQCLSELPNVNVKKVSSIDAIKDIAKQGGWNNDKTEKGRLLLSRLKQAFIDYNDFAFLEMKKEIGEFLSKEETEKEISILIIDIREPEEIEKIAKVYSCLRFFVTVLVVNDNVKTISSNQSDDSVFGYDTYDYIIDNSGSIAQLKRSAETFLNDVKKNKLGLIE